MPGKGSPKANKSGSVKAGDPQENEKQDPGSLKLEEAAQGDSRGELDKEQARIDALKFKEEPWFAKLPPSLRSAIQSKARNKAPRGYEERLKRYFESID